ncbi:MAG TPA: transporter substrate-binding domain-containing protein [Burkholderiaceae bacterium]|nr:transporter substrate-binding domain-containing protein [Burkholderiaceae bacterium]
MRRRLFLLWASAGLAGCAATPTRSLLAPTGELRVGVYLGSPTSLVRDAAGQAHGVAVELGQALAAQLGVPYRQVEFPRLALVLAALKAGDVDFTVTNATPARTRDMNFSDPVIALELGLLVPGGSPITAVDEMDRPGQRIGVAQGSSSQTALTARLRAATVVAAPTLGTAAKQLASGAMDAFATNKAILFQMADGLPDARVLPGRWGVEHLAIAIPHGREAAMDAVRRFAQQAVASGLVQRAADRAGLRGVAPG